MGLLPVLDVSHLLRTFLEISVVFYSLLVVVAFMTEGPNFQFKFDMHFPIYSTQRFLVGIGVRILEWGLRFGEGLMAPLYEASAEVGEWVAQRSSLETKKRLRSRFI